MYYIYHNAVKLNNFGYGCALGIILAIIIAIFSACSSGWQKSKGGRTDGS